MKLTEITLERVHLTNQHRIGRLSDGVNIIEGRPGAGKTAVRDFIRDTLLGNRRYGQPDYRPAFAAPRGQISVQHGSTEFSLYRDWDHGGRLQGTSLTSRGNYLDSFEQYLGQLNTDVYDAIYNFSLKQVSENLPRLARVLNQYFNVPCGSGGAGGDDALGVWNRERDSRKARHNDLRQQVERLSLRRVELARSLEQNDGARQSRLLQLDREIQLISNQINSFDLTVQRNHLASLDREISELRSFIDDIVRRESATPTASFKSSLPDPLQLLYVRLDEIDSQIRRWRRVQSDVQAQRVRLKDEMVMWNALTLESAEHPYHHARQHLLTLEERINQTDQQAKQWELAPTNNTDPSPSVRTIQALCQSMRQDLQQLSNELGVQYKHIRHRAAALELKQLRHCFNLMNENIERLVRRREQVINEVRFVDPAGAEAIVSGEVPFLQCALHEGYLEARRRFVGPLSACAEPTMQWSRTDLTEPRARLQSLQSQFNQLQRQIADFEASVAGTKTRLSNLIAERSTLAMNSHSLPSAELAQIDAEIVRLTAERDELARLIDAERSHSNATANTVLAHAALYLQQLSGGEWNRVWLAEGQFGGFVVANRSGLSKSVHILPSSTQQFVYLAIVFAAQKMSAGMGTSMPTVIDDMPIDLTPEQLGQVIQFFNGLQREGVQVLLLTEPTNLGREAGNFARFFLSLASDVVFVPTPSLPVIESRESARVIPISRSSLTSPSVLHSWVDSGDIDPVTLCQFGDSAAPPVISDVVSLQPASFSKHDDDIVSYPPVVTGSGHPYRKDRPGGFVSTAPVAVESFGDALGFSPAFDDFTELDRIDLLDPTRLRALSEVGVDTVAQLLQLPPENLPVGLRERGISADQVNRWQAIVWLLSTIPGMRVQDAKILVACGVTEPEHLATSHPQQLLERIQRFASSTEGQRFTQHSPTINLTRINGWMRALNTTRARWQNSTGFSRNARRRHTTVPTVERSSARTPQNRPSSPEQSLVRRDQVGLEPSRQETNRREPNQQDVGTRPPAFPPAFPIRNDLRPERELRQPFVARPPRMQTPEPSVIRSRSEFAPDRNRRVEKEPVPVNRQDSTAGLVRRSVQRVTPERAEPASDGDNKVRFHLDLKDHIEAAPSIGPKTAERFERIGVRSVEDFLTQTAESMAGKLKYQRITADLVHAWQHQTRLVCRIPNLRGHDAQLLVGCGLTEPEKIAAMQPQRLLDIVLPFARSKEGLKIVRTGKEPDLQEVTDWIKWAGMTRSLHAA